LRMFYKSDLIALFDIMALFLEIISNSGFTEEQFSMSSKSASIKTKYTNHLGELFDNARSAKIFIKEMRALYEDVKREEEEDRPFIAFVICIWLDKHFTYDNNDKMISLSTLVKLAAEQVVVLGQLNSNYKKTKIWINPKLPVHTIHKEGTHNSTDEVTNRSSWTGINCDLHNVAYFEWDGSLNVKNIIVSDVDFQDPTGQFFTVAFSPLSSEKDLVGYDLIDIDYEGVKAKGAVLKLKKDFSFFSERLEADLISAAKQGVDVFFMPEMLGTKELCGKEGTGTIDFIEQVSNKAKMLGLKLPSIIVLPSYWESGSNSATIVSNTGVVLGVQEKHIPFAFYEKGWVEALDKRTTKEMIIIHIRNAERLAIIICSEYLKDYIYNWSDVLCRSLGVTHILVPSYSFGESAFIEHLSYLRETGTSVTWGNCCGAIKSPNKGIGACSIAELNEDDVFGSKCKCLKTKCNGVKSCLFLERLTLNRTLSKTARHNKEHILKHIIKRRRKTGGETNKK